MTAPLSFKTRRCEGGNSRCKCSGNSKPRTELAGGVHERGERWMKGKGSWCKFRKELVK